MRIIGALLCMNGLIMLYSCLRVQAQHMAKYGVPAQGGSGWDLLTFISFALGVGLFFIGQRRVRARRQREELVRLQIAELKKMDT